MSNIDEDAFGSMAGALSKYGKGVGADPKKPRRASMSGQTMTGHIEKKVGSGTVYQKKLTHYGDHQEKPVVEKPEGEVKRGRGRPPGKHGSYKARSGDAAATAAKAAATKAANKAARNESMTEDDFFGICEMHELESFDDLLEFALELDEMRLDEASKAALGSYIKKASAKDTGDDPEDDEDDEPKEKYESKGKRLTKESVELKRDVVAALIESYESLSESNKEKLKSHIAKTEVAGKSRKQVFESVNASEQLSESMAAYVDGMKRLLPDF